MRRRPSPRTQQKEKLSIPQPLIDAEKNRPSDTNMFSFMSSKKEDSQAGPGSPPPIPKLAWQGMPNVKFPRPATDPADQSVSKLSN